MQTKSPQELTQAWLKELLHYDPATGVFTWRVQRGNRASGSVGGAPNNAGYIQLRVDKCNYLAHRLAFLYMTGAWPEHEIDHINGVRNDNRWANLRDVSRQQNAHNIGTPPSSNTSGLLGASWVKTRACWRATIGLNMRTRTIGFFPTAEQAHAAYLKAKDELHPTHQRLRVAA